MQYYPKLLLCLTFLFSWLLGAYAIYAVIIATIILGGIYAKPLAKMHFDLGITSKVFMLSFALFLIAFVVSSQKPSDIIFAFNYAALLIFIPMSLMLVRTSSTLNTSTVALFSGAGVIMLSMYAAFQSFVLGVARPDGIEIDTIAFGQTAVILGFIALSAYQYVPKQYRWVSILAPFLASFAAVLTQSRGVLIVIPFLALIFVLRNTRRPIFVVAGLAILGAISSAVVFWTMPSVAHRISTTYVAVRELITTGNISESSAGQRIDMYTAAFSAFKDMPWFGHGWEQRIPAIIPYLPADTLFFTETHHHLHSDIFDTMVSTGIAGLLAYALLIFGPVIGVLCSPRDSQYHFRVSAIMTLSSAYLLYGLTYLLIGYEYHTMLYVSLVAIISFYCRDGNDYKITAIDIDQR